MQLIERVIPPDGRILVYGCVHIGALTNHREGVMRLIDDLSKPNTVGLDLGDTIEAKLPASKHFSWSSVDVKNRLLTPQEQAEGYAKLFKPVKENIAAIGFGNHEYQLINTADLTKYIAKELETAWGSVTYKFIAKDPNGATRFKLLLHHGRGALTSNAKDPVQRIANLKATVKQRLINTRVSDCIGMFSAHYHQQHLIKPTYTMEAQLIDRDGRITQHVRQSPHQADEWIPPDSRWYGSTGCFRMSYTQPEDMSIDYGEVGMYGASDLGYLELQINDYQLTDVIGIRV